MLPMTSELHVELDTLRSIQVLSHKGNEKCLKLKDNFELYDVELMKLYCIITRAKVFSLLSTLSILKCLIFACYITLPCS